ncbi:MAG TPA: acylphosphatase [Anaerolineales bacterium]|jgi:acylphosphatase
MGAKRAHVWVAGRVQGVGYRYNTVQAAQRRGVAGWVRNLRDGRVEAVFEGPESNVEAMIDWCWNGSPAAQVSEVEVEWETPTGEFSGFHARR